MKISSVTLPALPPEVLESVTAETYFKLGTNFNNTPEPGSGLEPGEKTYTVTFGGTKYAATEDQVSEISKRTGLADQSKAFLAEKFPHLFGKAKA